MTHCFTCPTQTIVDPPRVVFRDFFHPQLVEIIHPIEIVNRHHCVPIPVHHVTFAVKDEFCHGPVAAAAVSQKSRKKAKTYSHKRRR